MSALHLEDFLDRSARDALYRPTGTAIGLPGRCYGAEFYDLERRKLFPRVWAPVAVGAQVPKPGDAVPVDLAGWPLIVLRDRAGEIRCFHNVCRHRGMRVLLEPRRVGRALRCPWHAWTYGLDGTLLATPEFGGEGVDEADGLCRVELGLVPVRTGRWLDYVLVNIDGAAPPLDQHVAPLDDLLAGYDLSGLASAGSWQHAFSGNWKVAMEGAIEDLHVRWGHPKILEGVVARHQSIAVADGCYAATSYWYHYDPDYRPNWTRRGGGFPSLLRDPGDPANRQYIINLFPHGAIAAFRDHLMLGLFAPDGADRTELHLHYYVQGPAATDPALAKDRRDLIDGWARVTTEDDPLVRYVDANKEARDLAGINMRFSAFWETAVHHFQKMVVEALSD